MRTLAIAVVMLTCAYPAQAGINVWTKCGPDMRFTILVIDPITPRTIYAGSGFNHPGSANPTVFKSTDGCCSWQAANGGLPNYPVTALAIDPTTPSTLYTGLNGFVGTPGGADVYKSTDGARSWIRANIGLPRSDAVHAFAIDPITPSTLYAAIQGDGASVFKSTDGGGPWSAASTGLTRPASTLAIDPTTPATIYAGTSAGAVGQLEVVYKSTDGARSWQAATAGLPYARVDGLAIDPLTPSTLYAAVHYFLPHDLGNVFKSTDAGATWGAATTGLANNDEVYPLAIDPITPRTVYAGTRGGVFKSTDGASTWSTFNAGLPNVYVYALAIDPLTPSTLYAATGPSIVSSPDGGVYSIQQIDAEFSGDCGNDGAVTVNEIITMVNIALGSANISACTTGDANGDGDITINEIIAAVNNALTADQTCPTP